MEKNCQVFLISSVKMSQIRTTTACICKLESVLSLPVQLYRKSYCSVFGVSISGLDKMLKFNVEAFMWWARFCQASFLVDRYCFEVVLMRRCYGSEIELPRIRKNYS